MQATPETKAFEKARAKREAKRAVEGALAHLDATGRRDVLAELFVELLDEPAAVSMPAKPPNGIPHTGRVSAARMRRAVRGRPRGSGAHGATATLLSFLGQNPRAPIKALAKAIYGADDTKAQNKVRSLLNAQKKIDPPRVRNVGSGQWEVVG